MGTPFALSADDFSHGNSALAMHCMQCRTAALSVVGANGFPIFKTCEGTRPSGPSQRRGKGNTMKSLIAQLRSAAEKHAMYRRTRDEIAGMPRRVALDLGIFPEDAEIIARKAVWG